MSQFFTARESYKVTLTHPTGFHNKPSYEVVVITTTFDCAGERTITRRCDCPAFGCSRDYSRYDATTDKGAIAVFLREHACTLVKATKKPTKK